MSGDKTRFMAFWSRAERSSRLWMILALVAFGLLFREQRLRATELEKPLMVVRVGDDGIPRKIVVDEKYLEPNDAEIRSFIANFFTFITRANAGSVAQDYAWCLERMDPKFTKEVWPELVGPTGLIAQIKALGRTTDIASSSLSIEINKDVWPWKVKVSGKRQVVDGVGQGIEEPVALDFELVRADRRKVVEGLVVYRWSRPGAPTPGAALGG